MKPEGSLAERDVPELVQFVHERRWTGALNPQSHGRRKERSGAGRPLVFASSTSPDERLGILPAPAGKFAASAPEAGRGRQAGEAAGHRPRGAGLLDPKDLVKAVMDHTQEIIYGAFLWTEAITACRSSGVVGGHHPQDQHAEIIMEGIRASRPGAGSPRSGRAPGLYARADRYGRRCGAEPPAENCPSSRSRGARTVDAICNDSSLGSFEVCRTSGVRVIGVVRPSTPRPPSPSRDEGLGSCSWLGAHDRNDRQAGAERVQPFVVRC